jgi:murein DD-endopeptidase MepM/ murein hydrolase activator NlpD
LDQKIKEFLPIKKIRPDDKIYLTFFQDSLKEITFSPSPEKKYSFIITPFGIKSYVKTVTSYSFLTKAQGKIKKNLYESALEQNIDPKLILELADIFGWDINFFTDIRPGDSYQFMYEKIYVNGKFLRVGQILAAEFINQNHCFKAYYFKIPNGQGEYYDPKGRPLRKTFLKSPLRYKRISSCFSYHRRHPILGIVRPHLGIDYAASIGTPVESVGDGRIIYIGWKGGYGKFIKIRHNHRYVSTYGHLSRFAKGLKTGSLVKQGEVIGYVGSTGLSTGPHLDFRFLANNKFIDYLKFNSPPNPPLSQKYYPAFKKELTYYKHLLEGPVYQVQLKMEKTGS